MGNDVSLATARTSIPLDDSVCWQLDNGANERSEPISIFVSKQTFSVECRRSIQFLKTVRHPNIIKFISGFKTYVDNDSFIADCVHPLTNKLNANDIDSTAKLCLGLYQLSQALEFLHDRATISHNNVCLLSLYINLNGIWQLGNFECACRYDNLNKKYLSSLKVIRFEECITPEEDEMKSLEINRQEIYSIDVYGFGILIRHLISIIHVDDSLKTLLNDLQLVLTDDDPHSRPTWATLLKTDLFQIHYIKIIELLDRLPTIETSNLDTTVDVLSTYLDDLDTEYLNELLIRRLFSPFIFLCSSTRFKLLPRLLIPKDTNNNRSWIPIEKYRTYVIPIIIDLFSYHVLCIRQTLLAYFNSYWQLIDETALKNIIVPQLMYGLKDTNNEICRLTLMSLASTVPILGAETIIGGKRKQIFTDTIKNENLTSLKTVSTTNSSVSSPTSPELSRKTSPAATKKIKSSPSKSVTTPKTVPTTNDFIPPAIIPSQYTNGYHSTLDKLPEERKEVIVENSLPVINDEDIIENDDDGHWSDWDNNPESPEKNSTNDSLVLSQITPSYSLPEGDHVKTTTQNVLSLKSFKQSDKSKARWDPNAPLGSEYEIRQISIAKANSKNDETKRNNDIEDFFQDMAPKIETTQLMQQLEKMFNANDKPAIEQKKSTNTTKSSSSITSKFSILSYQDNNDNQDKFDGSNNWEE